MIIPGSVLFFLWNGGEPGDGSATALRPQNSLRTWISLQNGPEADSNDTWRGRGGFAHRGHVHRAMPPMIHHDDSGERVC